MAFPASPGWGKVWCPHHGSQLGLAASLLLLSLQILCVQCLQGCCFLSFAAAELSFGCLTEAFSAACEYLSSSVTLSHQHFHFLFFFVPSKLAEPHELSSHTWLFAADVDFA